MALLRWRRRRSFCSPLSVVAEHRDVKVCNSMEQRTRRTGQNVDGAGRRRTTTANENPPSEQRLILPKPAL